MSEDEFYKKAEVITNIVKTFAADTNLGIVLIIAEIGGHGRHMDYNLQPLEAEKELIAAAKVIRCHPEPTDEHLGNVEDMIEPPKGNA